MQDIFFDGVVGDGLVDEEAANVNEGNREIEEPAFLEEIAAAGLIPDVAGSRSEARAAESSSSDSDSSSSSSSPSPAATPRRALPTEQAAPSSARAQAPVIRQVQDGTHRWGEFLLTWVPEKMQAGRTQPIKARRQATCRHHAEFNADGAIRTRCTRSITVNPGQPDCANSRSALRKLKSWLMVSADFASKRQHQLAEVQERGDSELQSWLQSMGPLPQQLEGRREGNDEQVRRSRKRPRDARA